MKYTKILEIHEVISDFKRNKLKNSFVMFNYSKADWLRHKCSFNLYKNVGCMLLK